MIGRLHPRQHATSAGWPASACARVLLAVCLLSGACSLDRKPIAGSASQTPLGSASGGFAQSGTGGGAGNAGSGVSTGGAGGSHAGDASADASGSLDGGTLFDGSIEAGPQGYTPGAVGAPCLSDAECTDDVMDRMCFTESYFAPLLTLPGGYCGKLCDPSLSAPCETGAACITFPTFPPVLACMRMCTTDADCRVQDGYSCNKPFTSDVSVCSLRN